jgi:hypothetical protein
MKFWSPTTVDRPYLANKGFEIGAHAADTSIVVVIGFLAWVLVP